jgi:hypothetical protein
MVHLTVNLSARDLFRGSPEFAPFQARSGAAWARIGSPAANFLSDTTAGILQALPRTRAKRTCRIATHMARLRFGKAYLDDQRVPSEDGCEAIRQCSGVVSTLSKVYRVISDVRFTNENPGAHNFRPTKKTRPEENCSGRDSHSAGSPRW